MTVQNTSVPRQPAARQAARAMHLRLTRDRAAIVAALAAPPAAAAVLLPVRPTWPIWTRWNCANDKGPARITIREHTALSIRQQPSAARSIGSRGAKGITT